MAQIKARQSRVAANQNEALKLFRHVIELNPQDYDACFEIAALFEQTEPKRALVYYEQGVNIMREFLAEKKAAEEGVKSDQPSHITAPFKFMQKWPSSFETSDAHQDLCQSMIPPELLNNLGVLMMQENRDAEAMKNFDEALTNCEKLLSESQDTEDRRLQAMRISVRFNTACCHDKASRVGEASEIYKSIIREEPSYTDAYMRLAYLAQRRGDMKRALDYIEQGKANHPKSENHSLPTKLYCMKGRLLTEMGQLQEAYKEYREGLDLSQKRDSYSRVGLANIHYLTSTFHRSNIDAQESELRKAMTQYFCVLEIDEMNTAASLGIGVVLSEYNKVVEAKEIFKVIENSETDPSIVRHAILNHAHLLMNEENSEYALNLYQAAHDRFPDDLDITLYLAKAHFKVKNYEKCREMTTKLLVKHPQDFRLKFNLALCLYNAAKDIFHLNHRRVKQTESAIRDLNVVKSLLTQFLALHQRTGGQPSNLLMSATASLDQKALANQCFNEMCREAESKLTYLNDML